VGAAVFLLLFFLGLILSTIGGIIGLVESFRVSTVWGLLFLFVPLAALVFYVKFWGREWTRRAVFLTLGGLASTLLAIPFLGGFINRQMANLDVEEVPLDDSVILDEVPLDEVPIDQQPLPEETLPEAGDGAGEDFAEPLVPAAPQLASIGAAELIQSTDPDERVQQVTTSRTDPFATVPIPPPPQPPPPVPEATTGGGTPVAGPTPAGVPAAPNAPTVTTAGGGGTADGGGTAGGGGTTAQVGGGTTAQAGGGAGAASGGVELPPISTLPQLPEPTLAQATSVSGVIDINGDSYAIVQAPDDASSRYVRVGQRVANGQVLVKRIETQGNEPVVVLEQNGIEVSRPIGAPAEASPEEENGETAYRFGNRFG
jgi:hypothetical protein